MTKAIVHFKNGETLTIKNYKNEEYRSRDFVLLTDMSGIKYGVKISEVLYTAVYDDDGQVNIEEIAI